MKRNLRAVVLTVIIVVCGLVAASAAPTMGFGLGGPMIGLFNLDLAGINSVLDGSGYAPLPESIVTFGGGGVGGVIGGFSFGGSGWGGSVSSLVGDKKAELSLGFGGMDLGYVLGGNTRSLLAIGLVAGGGEIELKLRDRLPVDFADAVSVPLTTTLTRGFIGIQPYVQFQVQPLVWMGFKVQLGYLFAFADDWEACDTAIAGPTTGMTGPYVGFAITFGGIGAGNDDKTTDESIEGLLEENGFDDAALCSAIKAFYGTHCGGDITVQTEATANITLVSGALSAMSRGDVDSLSPLLSPDVSWVSPDGFLPWSGTWVGKEALIANLRDAATSASDMSIDSIFTKNDSVCVQWHLPAVEGTSAVVYGMTLCRIVNGEIVSGRDYRN